MTSTKHPSVVVLTGVEEGTVLVIDEVLNDFSIGSDEGCHLVLSGAQISPMHAAVFLDEEGRVSVSDTKSRAGVYVNGTKVLEHVLAHGDEICVGPLGDPESRLLRFVAGAAAAMPTFDPAGSEPAGLSGPLAEPALEPSFDIPPLDGALLPPLEEASPEPAMDLGPPLPELSNETAPAEEPALGDLLPPSAPEQGLDLGLESIPGPAVEQAAAPALELPPPPPPSSPKPPRAIRSAPPRTVTPDDADDPLAGLAESLGGHSDEHFVPPPPVDDVPPPADATKVKTGASVVVKVARVSVVAALLIGVSWFGYQKYSESIVIPVVDTYLPNPVEPGQTFTINGSGFGTDPDPTVVKVLIGQVEVQALDATPTRINLTIPESLGALGSQTLALKVVALGTTSTARMLKVSAVPKVGALNPRVALTGDEVTLTGKWLANEKARPTVTVAGSDAEVLEASSASVRIKIPEVTAEEGQRVSVKITVGSDTGKEALLNYGRLPFVETVQPGRALPGEVVTLTGLGLAAAEPVVKVNGRAAVVLSATDTEVKFSAPGLRLSENAGERALTIQTGDKTSATHPLEILRESVALYSPRFFVDQMDDGKIAIACELGPVMVLGSETELRKQAHDAAVRLNTLVSTGRTERILFSAVDAIISAKDGPVLTVRPSDIVANPRVLALAWAAQLTDMFDLFLQGRRPGRTVEITPDGKVFLDIWAAARRRSSEPGVPQGVLMSPDPSWVGALNALARGPVMGTSQARTLIDGYWAGVIEVPGAIEPRKVEFSISIIPAGLVGQRTSRQGRLSSDVSLRDLSFERRELRFSFVDSGENLNYQGRLDGDTIEGTVSNAAGAKVGKLTLKLTR